MKKCSRKCPFANVEWKIPACFVCEIAVMILKFSNNVYRILA